MSRISKLISGLFLAILMYGCAVSWQPQPQSFLEENPTKRTDDLLELADDCFARADNQQILRACSNLYLDVLNDNPGNYKALVQLSNIHILIGTAYTEDSASKTEQFVQAMRYAEWAMYSNADFRRRVVQGETLWDAIDSLGEREAEAMFFWVTALQYEFKEGMSLPEKIYNIKWLQYALLVLERVEKVAPDFDGGGVEFAKAICYFALPERYGGSEQRALDAMNSAIENNEDWLLPRWGRAKYFYVVTDQPEKSLQELAWVASQDPADFKDPYPWRIHFIEDSAALVD